MSGHRLLPTTDHARFLFLALRASSSENCTSASVSCKYAGQSILSATGNAYRMAGKPEHTVVVLHHRTPSMFSRAVLARHTRPVQSNPILGVHHLDFNDFNFVNLFMVHVDFFNLFVVQVDGRKLLFVHVDSFNLFVVHVDGCKLLFVHVDTFILFLV